MPQQQFIDDEHSLTVQIRRALQRSTCRWNRSVQFETQDGQVVLKGVVRTYYEKQLAQESIRSIQGVRRVRNDIQVVR